MTARTITDLRPGACRWPTTVHPEGRALFGCDECALPGRSYCREYFLRAHRPATRAERRAVRLPPREGGARQGRALLVAAE